MYENNQKSVNDYFSRPKQDIEKETYLRKKKLGEGNFGVAYLIESTLTKIEYVCKEIVLSNLNKEDEEKTLSEVKILKKCKHPNIISFKEAFITRRPYRALHLITEYADCGDLQKKIIENKEKNENFPEKTIINWLVQICLALKYLKEKMVIHRDIKPSNIFLTKNGFIKIGDFGISKALNKSQNDTKTNIGTPYYMAPEVIESYNYDYKVDIWSLGITFFEIITFNLPFDGNSKMGLFRNITNGFKKMSINDNMSIYSDELINIVKKMYSSDPYKRPTIDEILSVPIIYKEYEEFIKINKSEYDKYNINLDIKDNLYNLHKKNIKDSLITIKEDENESQNVSKYDNVAEINDYNPSFKVYNNTEISKYEDTIFNKINSRTQPYD